VKEIPKPTPTPIFESPHLEEEVRKKTRKEKESEHGNNDPMAASE
jgi:hypothetical protein